MVKGEAQRTGSTTDHRPVQFPNTICKIGDKAMLEQYQADYIRELMPQQLGVGVKFAAELLVMGLRMIINMKKVFILINVDISNAFCEVMRAILVERHMGHERFREMVPYWRAKLGPTANLWSGKGCMEYIEGLVKGSPTSSSGFSYTIHENVKKANTMLVECGGCARLGMDDGHMIGPKEVVF